ncbi:exonuclease [bacterium]|nr:MAG: exonuclease [bacterium]
MLRSTFLHCPQIGEETERRLWRAGISDWDAALAPDAPLSLGAADGATFRRVIAESRHALETREHQYFARKLGVREAWRAFQEFRDDAVYLDIETDGGQSGQSITTIGMFDRNGTTCLVKGQDLENFRDLISKYAMIVTFYGSGFDLPMLSRRFPDIKFDQIHLDLCPTLKRVGIRGGLKKIERHVGIARGDETNGLTGWDAVKLWRRYEQYGDERALKTLVAYNLDDVVNLEPLAEIAYAELRAAALGEPRKVPATV